MYICPTCDNTLSRSQEVFKGHFVFTLKCRNCNILKCYPVYQLEHDNQYYFNKCYEQFKDQTNGMDTNINPPDTISPRTKERLLYCIKENNFNKIKDLLNTFKVIYPIEDGKRILKRSRYRSYNLTYYTKAECNECSPIHVTILDKDINLDISLSELERIVEIGKGLLNSCVVTTIG